MTSDIRVEMAAGGSGGAPVLHAPKEGSLGARPVAPAAHLDPEALKMAYRKVAGLVAGLSAGEVVANHVIGKTTIGFLGSKSSGQGPELMVALFAEALIANIFKGNCRHVENYKQLVAALLALPAFTAMVEGLSCLKGEAFVSEAFAIALTIVSSQLFKIMSHRLLGKEPFYHGEQAYLDETEKYTLADWQNLISKRQLANSAYLFAVNLITAVLGHYAKAGDPLSVITSQTMSGIYRKGGKTALNLVDRPITDILHRELKRNREIAAKAVGAAPPIPADLEAAPPAAVAVRAGKVDLRIPPQHEQMVKDVLKTRRRDRMLAITRNFVPALIAGVLAGSFFKLDTLDQGWLQNAWTVVKHYGGIVPAVAVTGYLTDQIPRALDQIKRPGPPAKASGKKRAFHAVGYLAVTAAAVGASLWNKASFQSSPIFDLGIKIWQNALQFHGLREIVKGTGVKERSAILAGAVGVQALGQYALNRLASTDDPGSASSMLFGSVFVVGTAVAMEHMAKILRNHILPKPLQAAH
jgi:hypothetical protein